MLQVIDSAYGEGSSSVFQGRFLNSIQELLIAPMSAFEIVARLRRRGRRCARSSSRSLITVLGAVFVHTLPHNWLLFYVVMIAARRDAVRLARRSSSGCLAEKFDHIAMPDDVRHHAAGLRRRRLHLDPVPAAGRRAQLSLFNPMFHMIDAFRYSYTGATDIPLWISTGVVAALTVIAFSVALRLVAIGYKLRT